MHFDLTSLVLTAIIGGAVWWVYALFDAWLARRKVREQNLRLAELEQTVERNNARLTHLEKLTDDRAYSVEPLDPLMASLGLELVVKTSDGNEFWYDFEGGTWRDPKSEQVAPALQCILTAAYDRYLTRNAMASPQRPGEIDISRLGK